jgi:NTE family protein
MSDMKVGLVLSGGGAKGAYHVGVVKALHELGSQVDVLAGASIGALNGAVLASAPTLQEGAVRLEALWMDLARTSPLKFNVPAYLQLLAATGLHIAGAGILTNITQKIQHIAGGAMPAGVSNFLVGLNDGALSDTPLQKHINQYLDQDALNTGLPLFVSVFKHDHALLDLFRCAAAELGIVDTAASEFIHIQSLPLPEQKEALLASAAIPLLFAPKRINDNVYSDGGQGGWQKMQGNTPITPLLDAGCNMVIVTHLLDGSLWSRHDFPNATILEIRPQSNISRDGLVPDILGFNAEKIPSWIEQGYSDTMHCVGRVMNATKSRYNLKDSEAAVVQSQDSSKLDKEMQEAMSRLSA